MVQVVQVVQVDHEVHVVQVVQAVQVVQVFQVVQLVKVVKVVMVVSLDDIHSENTWFTMGRGGECGGSVIREGDILGKKRFFLTLVSIGPRTKNPLWAS